MRIRQSPQGRFFTAALFAGLTGWSILSHPRLAPAMAAFAVAQGLLAIFWMRARSGRLLVPGYLGASYLGLAFLLAGAVDEPSGGRFWIIFAVVGAIFVPVWAAGRRLWSRDPNAS
jgi:hypothetical protein